MTNKSDFAPTGIKGLDYILCGGFPRNRVYLIQGDPGVGKTTLGLQFLRAGARQGEKGLYITLSESENELRSVAASHEWDLSGIEIYEHLIGEGDDAEDMTVFHPSEVELGETIQAIMAKVRQFRPQRLVIDALSEIRLLAQSSFRYRKQVLALKKFFSGEKITVLFLDERISESQDLQLQSVPHGVIELERYTPDYGAARRRMQIVKIRGLAFRDGFHDFAIRTGGLEVFPRLVAAEYPSEPPAGQISSGVGDLDAMLGGGVDRGSSTLIMGPAGAGKSGLATQYAAAAAERGEKALMFVFEEGIGTLFNRSRSLGIPLEEHCRSGAITLTQIDPAQLQPGEFAQKVRDAVEDGGVSVVVIDSINGYLNAVPEERFLLLHLHELLTYLGQHGVATILVFAQYGLIGTMHSAVDLSYLADSVVLLRYYESRGRLHKAISVVKKRGGEHETAIRELKMSGAGVSVGATLDNLHGVMTGVPQAAAFGGAVLGER
jgi:circadian clock protein KaiC